MICSKLPPPPTYELRNLLYLFFLTTNIVAKWNTISLIQPQHVDEETEVKRAKPEVKKKPQRKGGLFLPPMGGGTVEELGRY